MDTLLSHLYSISHLYSSIFIIFVTFIFNIRGIIPNILNNSEKWYFFEIFGNHTEYTEGYSEYSELLSILIKWK